MIKRRLRNGQQLLRKTLSTYLNISKRTRILHKDALLDSEYIDNMYSYNDLLCNKGGLTNCLNRVL